MSARITCLILAALVGLLGCDKAEEPAKTAASVTAAAPVAAAASVTPAAPTDPGETSAWRQWLAKGQDTTWLKEQWAKGKDAAWLNEQWAKSADLTQAAKASLGSINMEELKKLFSDFTQALDTKNFDKADVIAQQVGNQLADERMAKGLQFVILQRKSGGDAAVKAIEAYAARADLSPYEKLAAESLKQSMTFVQRDDVQSCLAFAIIFGCECKFGSHEGAAIGSVITMLLFPDFASKPTSSPQNP